MIRTLSQIAAVLVAVGWFSSQACAADWPQWHGPQRSGVSPESSGYPQAWPPKRAWRADVGYGAASCIIAEGKVYTIGWQGKKRAKRGEDAVVCLDASNGKALWSQRYASRYYGRRATGDQNRYGGPHSTPTYDAATKLLVTLGIDGDLRCWNTAERGKLVWAKNLYDAYNVPRRPNVGGGTRDFGFSCSPLVHGDTVIVEVGGKAGLLMAFDLRTGERRWRSQSTEMPGSNAGPVPMQVGDVECVASFGLRKLVVVRLDKGNEGKTLAEVDWATRFACNIPTPAVNGSRVLLTSAYNHRRASLFEIAPGNARQVWSSKNYTTYSSPVYYRGHFYLPATTCLDARTGARRWQSDGRGQSPGCLVVTAGDDRIIALSRGSLRLIDARPADGQYSELARLEGVVSGTPSMALADGVLLCKDQQGRVEAYSLKAAE